MDKCTECRQGSLSSFFESRLGVCADCCAVLVDRARVLTGEVTKLAEAAKAAKEFEELIENVSKLEKMGYEASQKGFDVSQNPGQNDVERDIWDSGWARGELARRTAQAIAVMEWSLTALEHVEEIARGNGQDEIAGKVSVVAEKIAGFVVPA